METPFLVDSKHGGAPVRGGWAARGGVGEQFLCQHKLHCTRCQLPVWEQISAPPSNALAAASLQGVQISDHEVCHWETSRRSTRVSK